MKCILGKKIGMSQVFDREGNVIPLTLIEAGPCVVMRVKTKETDGYEAIQVGWGNKKKIPKPLKGQGKQGGFRWLREFRMENRSKERKGADRGEKTADEFPFKVGDTLEVSIFQEGDVVKISGVSKGKGFQGVVKRHGFRGGPASHGTKHSLRAPGSIGSSFPEHVFKGMRMAGRMGGERITVRNLKVVKVDSEHSFIAVRGAVPGNRGTLLEIRGE